MGDLMKLLTGGRQQGKTAMTDRAGINQRANQHREEIACLKARLNESLHMQDAYRDAWELQKILTHNALVEGRNVFDELYELRARVSSAESYAEDWKRMYYGAIAKPPAVIK